MSLRPEKLAQEQLRRDLARQRRFPWIGSRKVDRMSRSPLAYLRGAAPLFYEALEREPGLADGPPGEGVIVGDLHLENFGAFRIDEDVVVFDLNDFDEAARAPLHLDLLRLLTSLILGGRTMGFDGRRALELARHLLDAYADVSMQGAKVPVAPPMVRTLVGRVEARTRRELLDARTVLRHGTRTFIRGERYVDLPAPLIVSAKEAFERYVASLPAEMIPHGSKASAKKTKGEEPRATKKANVKERRAGDPFRVLDVAFRFAGTGSLGALRIAILTEGKGVRDGAWVFDMKEENEPAASAILGKKATFASTPALQIVEAMHHCLPAVPKQLGTSRLGTRSLLVRRLAPQEDKLDLRTVPAAELEPLARHLGGLVGRAHARGCDRTGRIKPWSSSAMSGLLDRATVLAGVHEAAYLAMCRML